jgi:actin-like ATPase involved in cell morphogenesis
VPLADLVAGFLAAVRAALLEGTASVAASQGDALRATISVPANSNSNQRFVTIDAFRRAGFEVAGVLNEPSAAGVEYAHRYLRKAAAPKGKEYLAVYDFGGGTFDAAAIRIGGMRHDVVASAGAERLGGDDFDRILYEMVIERLGLAEAPDAAGAEALREECRERKEALNPNTKKLLVDASPVGGGEVVLDAREYYERCAPLIEGSLELLEDVLGRLPAADEEGGLPASVATVYLVGGSASFPPVARLLRERYGRRVQRSPYPHGSVALGLAVAANEAEHYFVRETLTRHFGVWREADAGARVVFDPIFRKDEALDGPGGLRARRRYRPAHNVGHFRFLECGALTPEGEPTADLTPWGEVAFPFEPSLQVEHGATRPRVERMDGESRATVVEEYTVDPAGIISVTLRDESTGYERCFRLGAAGSLQGD